MSIIGVELALGGNQKWELGCGAVEGDSVIFIKGAQKRLYFQKLDVYCG